MARDLADDIRKLFYDCGSQACDHIYGCTCAQMAAAMALETIQAKVRDDTFTEIAAIAEAIAAEKGHTSELAAALRKASGAVK